ncbi:hypothetical protein V8E52_008019 [Russula decolorans]
MTAASTPRWPGTITLTITSPHTLLPHAPSNWSTHLPATAENRRYAAPLTVHHWTGCTKPFPASCIECQMIKVTDMLLSGREVSSPSFLHVFNTSTVSRHFLSSLQLLQLDRQRVATSRAPSCSMFLLVFLSLTSLFFLVSLPPSVQTHQHTMRFITTGENHKSLL